MSSIAPPQPKYHHYRPLEGDARVRAEPRPCLKCMVCLSPCRCDAEAEERKRMRESREGEGASALRPPQASRGWCRTIPSYSWSDGDHPDHPEAMVTVLLGREELGAPGEVRKENVSVEFTQTSVSVEIALAGDRRWIFRRDPLYEPIDPCASAWYLTARRIVLKLAKADRKKKWPGLTPVFATLERRGNDALDFGLAAMTGSTGHLEQRKPPVESAIIASSERDYWQGPPKYKWTKDDRAYQN